MIVIKLSNTRYRTLLRLCAWTWDRDANDLDVNPSEYLRTAGSHFVRL